MSSKEDLDLFISEAEDLINKTEEEILILEESPGNTKPIQELYFTFHTLKGLTAMIGLDNVSKFCHNFENLLDKTKDTKLSKNKSQEIVNLMFESLDVLRSVLNNVKKGKIQDIDASVVDELEGSFEGVESEYEITFIKQITPEQVNSIINDKRNIFYKISIRIQSTCVFKKVRLFIIFRALNDIGQIYWSDPEPRILEAGECDLDFEVFYMSRKNASDITKILDEILEIENKIVKRMSAKEFNDVLSNAAIKMKKPARKIQEIEQEPEEIYVSETADDSVKGISQITTGFEDDTGKITSVKVNIEVIEELMDDFGEVIILKNQLSQILKEKGDWGVSRYLDGMDKLFLEIQEIIFKLKLVRVESTFRRYRRLVRDVSKETGKNVKFTLEGTDVELDRKILEELNGPLIHLLRNAIYHGIELPRERRSKGKPEFGDLRLSTSRRAGSIFIDIAEDGKGIDYDRVRQKAVELGRFTPEEVMELSKDNLSRLLFTPGFSTLKSADMISGRGMGLAIVAEKIKELGGSLNLTSEPGQGSTFTLIVPFSRAILKAQLLKVSGDLYAIPLESIHQIYFFDRTLIEFIKGEEYYRVDNDLVPVVRLNKFLNIFDMIKETIAMEEGTENIQVSEKKQVETTDSIGRIVIYCNKGEKDSAVFIADDILNQMDVVIKPFRSRYSTFQEVLGVTITGDGEICLIIDVSNIISSLSKELKVLKSIKASQ